MAIAHTSHTLGPAEGSLRVHTYREGMAQAVGHDLIIEVGAWQATVDVAEDGEPVSVNLEADPRSLQVLEGQRGVKPLTDKDRAEIRANIEQKLLGAQPITFRSTSTQLSGRRLLLEGELTIAGTPRPTSFQLELGDDSRLRGSLAVVQSQWGIKPYRAFMGALKVRDAIDVVLDVAVPFGQ